MGRECWQGSGWGDAKQRLFERIDSEVAPLRERYETLMAEPQKIERLLRDGARRLREAHAQQLLRELRAAVGLRDLSQAASGRRKAAPRSEEHTSELQSLMRSSYAVFCLNKKKDKT